MVDVRATVGLFAATLLLAAGCSDAPPRQNAAPRAPVTAQASRPDWVRRVPAGSSGDIFFVGLASGAANLEEGRRRSRHEAYAQIGEYLGQEIKIDYRIERSVSQSGSSPALTRTVVQDVQKAIVDQVAARAKVKEVFEEHEPTGILNVWTLVSFPTGESGRVVVDALNTTEAGYRASNRQDAIDVMGLVRDQLTTGR